MVDEWFGGRREGSLAVGLATTGEGSRPRPAAAGWFAEPITFCKRGSKLRIKVGNTFAAREDPTSPSIRIATAADQ
jgi:hypothetical protein